MKTKCFTILILSLLAIAAFVGCNAAEPEALQLAWPPAGEAVDPNPMLQWQPFAGAAEYRVTVTGEGAETPVFEQNTAETNIPVAPALAPGSYNWHVEALNDNDKVVAELESAFSVKDAITLRYPPLEEPVDPAPILQWDAYPGAASYQVIVLEDAAFPPEVMLDQVVNEPMLAVDPALAPGHYSWNVYALDEESAVLAELTSTFSVKDVVALVAPAAFEEVGAEPLLQWQAYPGAASYQVIVINDDAFPPVVVCEHTTTDTAYTVSPPLEPASYSWRVWAFDGNDKLVAELNSNLVVKEAQ
jgi:hypothetical protein